MEQAAVNRKVEGSNPFSGASKRSLIKASFFIIVVFVFNKIFDIKSKFLYYIKIFEDT